MREARYALFGGINDQRNKIGGRRKTATTVPEVSANFKFGGFLPKSHIRSLPDPQITQPRESLDYIQLFTVKKPRAHHTVQVLYITSVTLRIAILLSSTLSWTCSYTIHIIED